MHSVMKSENEEIISCYLDFVSMYLNSAKNDDYDIRKLAYLGIIEVIDDLNLEFREKLCMTLLENIKKQNDIKTR